MNTPIKLGDMRAIPTEYASCIILLGFVHFYQDDSRRATYLVSFLLMGNLTLDPIGLEDTRQGFSIFSLPSEGRGASLLDGVPPPKHSKPVLVQV